MKKLLLLTMICLAASITGAAQVKVDTIYHYSCGNIQERDVELETVNIRPTCKCSGICTCACSIDNKGYSSASLFAATDEILSAADGVSLTRRGNYALEAGLRNLTGGRINITIDGMKVFGACTDKMDPVTSYLEPNNLRSLSVAHGTAGSAEGSTIGGSIQMKLNEPVINTQKPFRGEAGLGFQSSSLGLNSLLSLNYGQKRWAVLVSGAYRLHQDYRAGNGNKIANSQYRKGNFSASGKFLITERDVMRLDFLLDDARDVGYPALPMDVAYAKADIYALTYKRYPSNPNISLWETKVYANTVRHAMDDTQREDVPMHMDMPGQTLTAGAYSKFSSVWDRHKLDFLGEGYYNRSLAEMTMYPADEASMYMVTWPDVRRGDGGFYLNYQYGTANNSALNLSLRVEALSSLAKDQQGISQMEVFGYHIDERSIRFLTTLHSSYLWNITERAGMRFSAGYGERAPTVSEQYAFFIFNSSDGYDYLGKPDINVERSAQTEVSLTVSSNKIEISPAGFYYYIHDYITGVMHPELSPMTPGALGVKYYENLNGAHLCGGSLRLTYRPLEGLSFVGQMEYTYAMDTDKEPLAQISPLESRFSVKYEKEHFQLVGECEVAARQDRINEQSGETATPAYALLHIRGTYTFDLGGQELRLNAGIENLLDSNYRQHLDWGGIPRPGINVYCNVNLSF